MLKIIKKEQVLSIVVSLILFASVPVVFAWTAPGSNPPDGNAPAPINVSGVSQLKSGFLNLYGPNAGLGVSQSLSYGVANNLLVGVNGYVGAKKYCNETGLICRSIEELIGGTVIINNSTTTPNTCRYEQKTATVTLSSKGYNDQAGAKVVIKTLRPGTWTVAGSGTAKFCGGGCYTMGMAIRYTKNGAYVPGNKFVPPSNGAVYAENLFNKYWPASVANYNWTIPPTTFTLTQEERLESYAAQTFLDGTLNITGPELVCD